MAIPCRCDMAHGDEMRRFVWILVTAACVTAGARAQTALDWQEVQARFQAANPALRAGLMNIDEARAQEITAYLRPNPKLTAGLDQLQPFSFNPYRPLTGAFPLISLNYLHEREHKRELRVRNGQQPTPNSTTQPEA